VTSAGLASGVILKEKTRHRWIKIKRAVG